MEKIVMKTMSLNDLIYVAYVRFSIYLGWTETYNAPS